MVVLILRAWDGETASVCCGGEDDRGKVIVTTTGDGSTLWVLVALYTESDDDGVKVFNVIVFCMPVAVFTFEDVCTVDAVIDSCESELVSVGDGSLLSVFDITFALLLLDLEVANDFDGVDV